MLGKWVLSSVRGLSSQIHCGFLACKGKSPCCLVALHGLPCKSLDEHAMAQEVNCWWLPSSPSTPTCAKLRILSKFGERFSLIVVLARLWSDIRCSRWVKIACQHCGQELTLWHLLTCLWRSTCGHRWSSAVHNKDLSWCLLQLTLRLWFCVAP